MGHFGAGGDAERGLPGAPRGAPRRAPAPPRLASPSGRSQTLPGARPAAIHMHDSGDITRGPPGPSELQLGPGRGRRAAAAPAGPGSAGRARWLRRPRGPPRAPSGPARPRCARSGERRPRAGGRRGKGRRAARRASSSESVKSPFCAITEPWQLLGGTGDDSA